MAKKKYLGEKVEATEFQATSSSMVKDVLAMTLESKEEREKREAEQRKKILSLYKKDMTQAEAIAAIDELSDLVKYDDGLMKDGAKFFKVIMKAQNINEFQALVFSIMFCVGPRHGKMNAYDIGNLIGKNGVFVLQHSSEIDAMCEGQNRLLMRSKQRCECLSSYSIRPDAFDAVLKNETFTPKSLKKNTVEALLLEFRNITNDFSEDCNFDNYKFNVEQLLEENSHLDYVKKLRQTFHTDNDSNVEMRMFMIVCDCTIRGYNRISIDELLSTIEDQDSRIDMQVYLRNGDTYIHYKKLVEFGCVDGLADRTTVQLTKKAIKKFLPKVKGINQEENSQTSIIKHDKISKKELFFPDEFKKDVDNLFDLLSEDKFKEIQNRLKKKNQTTGFAGLFYGAPGVGKTELVMQLAKATGRDVMQVNISEIKSMWVGESEKNIQAIFDNYRNLCKGSDRVPILLFNESDAIINKRLDTVRSSVDKMSNAMQNIILNEMEKLNGLMLCTSNLVDQNLDGAYSRRFLYKLKFPETTPDVRAKIWLSKLDSLSEDDALTLSKKFSFSGGQIDNVVRRWNIDEILYGTPENMLDKLTELCESEKLEKMNNRKIGFQL